MTQKALAALLAAPLIMFTAACVQGSAQVEAPNVRNATMVDPVGNTVSSFHNPTLKIAVDASLKYLGRHEIRIRDIASGERIIFADVQDGAAARTLVLQFEGFNENVEDHYRYDLSKSPVVAGYRWRSNAFAFSVPKSIRNNSGAEMDSTADFFRKLNIVLPDNLIMWRSLTVTSDDKRNELILFYYEDMSSTGKSLHQFYDENGNATAYWRNLMPTLEQRANSSFELALPNSEKWRNIPDSLESSE